MNGERGRDRRGDVPRKRGSLNMNRGGVVTLAESAVALGTMRIDGTLSNHGTRGTNVHGAGVIDDREGSTVRPPDETRDDGTAIYWD